MICPLCHADKPDVLMSKSMRSLACSRCWATKGGLTEYRQRAVSIVRAQASAAFDDEYADNALSIGRGERLKGLEEDGEQIGKPGHRVGRVD